jgi:DNA-binding NarL/FixJ family response regulator
MIHKLAPVPVIVFSFSDHQEDVKASYRHRANAYMVKSLDLNESFSCLQDLCHFWWDTITLPKKQK